MRLITGVRRGIASFFLCAALCGCASKWQEERELAEARQAGSAEPPGDPASCPKVSLGTLVLDACCTSDNQCGGDGTKVGYGCSSLADPMFRSFVTNPPEPRKCAPLASGNEGLPSAPMPAGAVSGSSPIAAASSAGSPAPSRVSTVVPSPSGGSAGAGATASGAMGAAGSAPPTTPSAGAAGTVASGDGASMCPSFMAFGMTVQPCCTPDNHCGADGTAMGFGCTDIGDAMFRMIAGAGVPAPQTCDGMKL